MINFAKQLDSSTCNCFGVFSWLYYFCGIEICNYHMYTLTYEQTGSFCLVIYLICGFIFNCQADSFTDISAECHILYNERACHSCGSHNNLEVDEFKLNRDATCYVQVCGFQVSYYHSAENIIFYSYYYLPAPPACSSSIRIDASAFIFGTPLLQQSSSIAVF